MATDNKNFAVDTNFNVNIENSTLIRVFTIVAMIIIFFYLVKILVHYATK